MWGGVGSGGEQKATQRRPGNQDPCDKDDELAEWVSTPEELVDRGHPPYYVWTHKDTLYAENAPDMSRTFL